ncbi:MobA/MobL family protein, partial [Escherichia coli]|uniref:MobA/MobL family protein n=1 Tax=Escherichia coli TaxID=562 RepID=UPI003EE38A7C
MPPIASGEYGKNRTKTAMIFSGWQHGSSLPFVRCSALPSGYSAVASAAYRSGSLMLDERTGLTHDYTRKSGVAEAVILTP